MHENETALMSLLSEGQGTRTLLGGSGSVKERIRRVGAAFDPKAGSCGGTTGGWGNSPEADPEPGSCGGTTGGWGNSPE